MLLTLLSVCTAAVLLFSAYDIYMMQVERQHNFTTSMRARKKQTNDLSVHGIQTLAAWRYQYMFANGMIDFPIILGIFLRFFFRHNALLMDVFSILGWLLIAALLATRFVMRQQVEYFVDKDQDYWKDRERLERPDLQKKARKGRSAAKGRVRRKRRADAE